MANRVRKYKKNITLEPMNPYERRIIHSEVQNITNVSTVSIGQDSSRRVVIFYTENGQPTASQVAQATSEQAEKDRAAREAALKQNHVVEKNAVIRRNLIRLNLIAPANNRAMIRFLKVKAYRMMQAEQRLLLFLMPRKIAAATDARRLQMLKKRKFPAIQAEENVVNAEKEEMEAEGKIVGDLTDATVQPAAVLVLREKIRQKI